MEEKRFVGFLRKSMTRIGEGVEKVLGQAKKAKGTYEKKIGPRPILSLESRLPAAKLKSLIDHFGDRFVPPMLPSLKDKTVLEAGEPPVRFQQTVVEQRPKFFCAMVVGDSGGAAPGSGMPILLKGTLKALPFEDRFFDCVLLRLTTPQQGDVVSAIKELGRVLQADGSAVVLDYHPFGLYAKSGTERLRSVQATIRGMEDYFKMCRVAGLQVVDVHEGFVDDSLRNQFITPEELAAFREIKGTPLVLALQVVKVREKR